MLINEGKPMQMRPYGDTANDGMVQLSFSLPLPLNAHSQEAARRYAMLMGISNPLVAHAEAIDKAFTFFVIYGACSHMLDPATIKVDDAGELAKQTLDFHEINTLIEERLGRRVTVIGATIESDAHTVGIDAIFNAKGFAGNYGLERFPAFRALNLGAQVSCEALLRRGWTKNSLLKGTEILVEGYQAKDGANRANGSVITFTDGKKLFVGSSAGDPGAAPGAPPQ